MAKEQIADFVVSITFDDAMKKLKAFDDKIGGFHKKQQQASVKLRSMQQVQYKQLQANIRQTQREENHAWKQKERIEKEIRRAERAAYKEKSTREDRFQKDIRGAYRTNAALDKKNSDKEIANAKRVADARVKLDAKQRRERGEKRRKVLEGSLFSDRNISILGADVAAAKRKQILAAKTKQDIEKIERATRRELANNRFLTQERKKQSFWMRRMQASSEQMAGNMISAFAIAGATVGVTKIGQDFDRAENTLTAITGSTEKATKEMEYLRELTYSMGVPLRETAKDYSKLMASAKGTLDDTQLKSLFESLAQASVVMGTTADDTSGILKALSQMLAKQKVSAEEYRQQLGDRMPIALQAMSKAAVKAGVITQDMIDNYGSASGALEKLMAEGKLYSKDVLPHFGEIISETVAPGLDKALKSNLSWMNRFKNAYESAADTIYKSGFEENLTELFEELAGVIKKDLVPLFEALGQVFGIAFDTLKVGIKIVTPLLKVLGYAIREITDILGGFSLLLIPLASPLLWYNIAKGTTTLAKAMTALYARLVPVVASLALVAGFVDEITNAFKQDKEGLLWSPQHGFDVEKNVFQSAGVDTQNMRPTWYDWFTKNPFENIDQYATSQRSAIGQYISPNQPTTGSQQSTQADVYLDSDKVGTVMFSTQQYRDETYNLISHAVNPE